MKNAASKSLNLARPEIFELSKVKQQRDELAELIQESIGIIDCLVDFVCEGGSILLNSIREANDFMDVKARAALAKVRGEGE